MTTEDTTRRMVVGFAFNRTMTQVALIEKNRPHWQAGKVNGIGGGIEEQDQRIPERAMRREFKEETGYETDLSVWEYLATLERTPMMVEGTSGVPFTLHMYRAILSIDDLIPVLRSQTDEQVLVVNPRELPSNGVSNLYWMVAMAMDTNPGDGGAYHIGGYVGRAAGSGVVPQQGPLVRRRAYETVKAERDAAWRVKEALSRAVEDAAKALGIDYAPGHGLCSFPARMVMLVDLHRRASKKLLGEVKHVLTCKQCLECPQCGEVRKNLLSQVKGVRNDEGTIAGDAGGSSDSGEVAGG